MKFFLSNSKVPQRFYSHPLPFWEMAGGEYGAVKKPRLQILFQKSLAEQRLSHLRAGDSKISPIGNTLRLSAEVNKSVMMKAGHSSGLGSNENVSVLCSLKTDNSTVLQELFNIYHHLQELKRRQGEQQQKKPSDSLLRNHYVIHNL